MKKHLPKLIVVFMLIIGFALLFYPDVSTWWNSRIQAGVLSQYQRDVEGLRQEEIDDHFRRADEVNEELSRLPSDSTLLLMHLAQLPDDYMQILNINDTMGRIRIPSIDVDLPIFHTTGSRALDNGVGHLEGTAFPVGGYGTHSGLTAHTGLPNARLFTDLEGNITYGDLFFIHVLDRILAYQVDRIITVWPHEVDGLRVVPGEDFVTLITCTPYGTNSHRLLVRGRRIEFEVAAALEEEIEVEFVSNRVDMRIYIFLGFFALFMLGFMIYQYMLGKREKEPVPVPIAAQPGRPRMAPVAAVAAAPLPIQIKDNTVAMPPMDNRPPPQIWAEPEPNRYPQPTWAEPSRYPQQTWAEPEPSRYPQQTWAEPNRYTPPIWNPPEPLDNGYPSSTWDTPPPVHAPGSTQEPFSARRGSLLEKYMTGASAVVHSAPKKPVYTRPKPKPQSIASRALYAINANKIVAAICAAVLILAVGIGIWALRPSDSGASSQDAIFGFLSRVENHRATYNERLIAERMNSGESGIIDLDVFNEGPFTQVLRQINDYNRLIYERGQPHFPDPFSYSQPGFTLTHFGFDEEMIGFITIPRIGAELPIFMGTSQENLHRGLAHLTGTSLPVGGESTNAVIAGYMELGRNQKLRGIEQLDVGDELTVTNFYEEIIYRVVEMRSVSHLETEALKVQGGKDLITLLTPRQNNPQGVVIEWYVVIAERAG